MGLPSNIRQFIEEAHPGRILDVRPAQAFEQAHLPGAASHPVSPVPAHTVAEDHFETVLPSIFLPPREVPLLVVGDRQNQTQELAAHLQARGRGLVLAQDAQGLPADTMTERGPSAAHLWSAPPWLVDHCELLPPPAAGPVLDLACGSGRAAVWLAEQGYRVTGIDWQPEAVLLGRRLAEHRGVTVDWQQADLRESELVPAGPWSIILNFRYLQRDLLARMANMLQPGGVAMVRTFRNAPGYTGHPHLKHRLATGELLGNFPAGICEILAHEESHDPDGRPAAGIVARRRII